jgi:hypothetical protein
MWYKFVFITEADIQHARLYDNIALDRVSVLVPLGEINTRHIT